MLKKALGKGLSALMPEKPVDSGTKVATLDITDIYESRFQPRQEINPVKLAELAASIKEKGVIQPILVRPREQKGYELIAGERRLQAARQLNFTQLPAIIRDVSDAEALQMALIENLQREELNAIEEAQAFAQLMQKFGYGLREIAKMLGKDVSTISNSLRLLKLPNEIQQAVRKGKISMGQARTLLAIRDLDEQGRIFRRTLTEGLSVGRLEQISARMPGAVRYKSRGLKLAREPHIVALEEEMQRILGTRVRIVPRCKRGKIVLEYYSPDDLERIINLLKKI